MWVVSFTVRNFFKKWVMLLLQWVMFFFVVGNVSFAVCNVFKVGNVFLALGNVSFSA